MKHLFVILLIFCSTTILAQNKSITLPVFTDNGMDQIMVLENNLDSCDAVFEFKHYRYEIKAEWQKNRIRIIAFREERQGNIFVEKSDTLYLKRGYNVKVGDRSKNDPFAKLTREKP